MNGRRLPCLCDRDGAPGRLETDLTETVACSEARGFVEEEIECRLCGRTWRRRTRD